MDRFDEVFSILTEDQGWSAENANKIMVYCAEQGMNPIEAGARFVAGMAGLPSIDLRKNFFNPWNMFPKKPEPQKGLPKPESSRLPTRALPPSTVDAVVSKPQKPQPAQAPKPAFSSVGTTTVQPSQTPQQSKAPAPQWGGSSQAKDIKRLNQLTGGGPLGDRTIRKPVVSSGRMGAPQGPSLSTNVAPKPQFATSMGQAPKPAWNATLKATPKNLFGRLTSNRYVKAAVSAVPFVLGTDALIRGDQSIIGRQMRSGPELTPEIIKGVQQREKLAQQSAETKASNTPTPTPTGERSASANTTKQEVAKTGAERRRAAAASFDKEFAAARAAGKDVFTWRGKQYNTKLK